MKWEISAKTTKSVEERRIYWETIHGKDDYSNVMSLTDDPEVCERIERTLGEYNAKRILVPGCGSRTGLQQWLVERAPWIRTLVCTDFSAVVAKAEERFSHPAVEYRAANSTDLPWSDTFDAAVVVNSILSESDRENRQMLASIRQSLHAGGMLLGFFPTVFSTLEIAHVSNDQRRQADLDLERSMKFEPAQDAFQIFYTPLRLRMILREAGFDLLSMEVHFLDSKPVRGQAGEWNEFTTDDDDLAIYEHYVVARAV
jgi:hypothetical protein